MKVYLVYCVKEGLPIHLHIEGVFTHLSEIEHRYGDIGYKRKGTRLYDEDGEHHYDIITTELIGHILYSDVKQLYDERGS